MTNNLYGGGDTVAEVVTVELRCPSGLRKLLGKVQANKEETAHISSDNLVELSCRECRRDIEKISNRKPNQVVHLFDMAGEFVNTEIRW